MKFNNNFMRSNNFGLLLLRLNVGGLMLFHGIAKAMGGYTFIEKMLEHIGPIIHSMVLRSSRTYRLYNDSVRHLDTRSSNHNGRKHGGCHINDSRNTYI